MHVVTLEVRQFGTVFLSDLDLELSAAREPSALRRSRTRVRHAQIYVSADGKARLLRIVSTKANPGTLDFSEWDAIPPISPPPASQMVKIPGFS
jgi:hypothetical protein